MSSMVKCEICKKEFKRIVSTHLKSHGISTVSEYKKLFPNSNTSSEETLKKLKLINKGRIFSKEHRQRISLWHKDRKLSEDHKRNIGLGVKGEKNGFYGKRHSKSTKDRLREINTGKHASKATKKKMSVARKDKKRPDFSGENHPFYGKKRPEHSRMMKGKPSKLVGRPNPRQKERMNNGGASHANSFIKSPSKPQVQLYEKIKILYPVAILNYPCQNYSIDIAIPDLKIAVEYDGAYWHEGQEEYDKKRQMEIEQLGWKFLRYSELPNDIELDKDLKRIINKYPSLIPRLKAIF